MAIKTGVVIGFVHPGVVRTEFMRTILLVVRNGNTYIHDVVDVSSGANISRARNTLVSAFLDSYEADWLWMVDTDMVFPQNALDVLMNSADSIDRPIIGGLYNRQNDKKSERPLPVMYDLDVVDGKVRFESPEKWIDGDCIKVDATGAGCLLIHRSVLLRIADKFDPPASWFFETLVDGTYFGEDITFCMRASSENIPIYVNTNVKVGHVKNVII